MLIRVGTGKPEFGRRIQEPRTMTKPNSSPVPSAKGTRDLYPDQMLRQNYITRLWRDTAIRHGFEEINGPTFEMLELYTRKSGEGIVSELFRFRREGGDDDYALRPEFTPTLARMYAAKAASLPSPTKWFSIGPYFRAEKPQRGRLREFLQWNVDVLGEEQSVSENTDSEVISTVVALLLSSGLVVGWGPQAEVTVHLNHRSFFRQIVCDLGLPAESVEGAMQLADRVGKISQDEFLRQWSSLGGPEESGKKLHDVLLDPLDDATDSNDEVPASEKDIPHLHNRLGVASIRPDTKGTQAELARFFSLFGEQPGKSPLLLDPSIVRGLAYYTGTVFEVIADGERAIAGGGRYDNLIELFGGPSTPAVGFGMGDVVLGLLLDDKGLMPQGIELLDALSRPAASLRPEAFVVAGSEDEDALIEPLLASLRRGIEADGFDGKPWSADRYAVRPMHARRTYKTTRNLKKLLADAEKQHARFAIVLHGPDKVQVKDLDTREELVHDRGDFAVDPASDAYVGRAIVQRLA